MLGAKSGLFWIIFEGIFQILATFDIALRIPA